MNDFGAQIIELAVKNSADADTTVFHLFDRNAFHEDVEDTLVSRYSTSLINVVEWYHETNDLVHALAFTESRLGQWSDQDLIQTIIGRFSLRPQGLMEELSSRNILVEAAGAWLQSDDRDLAFAEEASNRALNVLPVSSKIANQLHYVWGRLLTRRRGMKERVGRKAGSSPIYLLLSLYLTTLKPPDTALVNAAWIALGRRL
jgi:hypothetical protein